VLCRDKLGVDAYKASEKDMLSQGAALTEKAIPPFFVDLCLE
jgi:hypothetical protein